MYKDHYNSLYFFALKSTQSHAIASDCIQNLFLNLWNSRKNLSSVTVIKPYLFKALRRDLSRVPRLSMSRTHTGGSIPELESAPVFSPEDLLVEDESRQYLQSQLLQALNTLPGRQREAIYLKYYEDLSYKEIASIMGVNYQSVVNLLFKAMASLKKEEHIQKLSALLQGVVCIMGAGYSLIF